MTTKVKPTVEKWVQELIQIVCDSMIERLGLEPDGHRTWATTTDEIVKELSEELYEQLPHSLQEAKAERVAEIENSKIISSIGYRPSKFRGLSAVAIYNMALDDLLASLKQEEGE